MWSRRGVALHFSRSSYLTDQGHWSESLNLTFQKGEDKVMLKYQILPQLPEPCYWTLLKDQLPNQRRTLWVEDLCVEVNLEMFQHETIWLLSHKLLWVRILVTDADEYYVFCFVFIEKSSSSSVVKILYMGDIVYVSLSSSTVGTLCSIITTLYHFFFIISCSHLENQSEKRHCREWETLQYGGKVRWVTEQKQSNSNIDLNSSWCATFISEKKTKQNDKSDYQMVLVKAQNDWCCHG